MSEVLNMLQYWAHAIALPTTIVVLSIGLAQNIVYAVHLGAAYLALHGRLLVREPVRAWRMLSETTIPISLLVPAYNEQATIIENVRSMLALHYPNFEIIIINDGSTDETLQTIIDAFELTPVVRPHATEVPHADIRGLYGSPNYRNLIVVDKANGGKADALNAGINLSRFPLFCAVDADSILEADALLRAVQPFTESSENVVAVGGTVRIANGCEVHAGRIMSIGIPHKLVPLFQVMDYLRAFLIGRLGSSKIDTLMVISGAFGIFRRGPAIEAGGYDLTTVGEDMEIIVKLRRQIHEQGKGGRIVYVSDPVCWTEAPETLRVLGRQRMRWQRGTMETFFRHIKMLFNPRYGMTGMVAYPLIFLADILGPIAELVGILILPIFWYFDLVAWDYLAAFLALTVFFGIFISVGSLFLEELELRRYPRPKDLLLLTMAAILENFGYRQLSNLWRIFGFIQFIFGLKGSWGEMTRAGFKKN